MRYHLSIIFIIISTISFSQTIPYNLSPDWSTQPNGFIDTGLGLADINGDGYKDMVVANGNDIERQNLVVYYNQGNGTFPLNPSWQSADVDYHGHLACGDLDNDGDIDVAVSVYIGESGFSSPGKLKIYYNLGNQLESSPSYESDPFYTFSCAMGDADADGDLDIATVAGEPYSTQLDYGKIFLNNNGTFQPVAEWQSDVLMGALDVEFGDINMDHFLDVIYVCEGTPSLIYLANTAGIIDETPDWQCEELQNYINSVEVGYENDHSYIVMTENDQLGGEGRVQRYDFSHIIPATSSADWYSDPFGYGSGIAVKDVDRNGIQDLIYGGWWLPVKIALGLGSGSGYELNTSYTSSTASVVEAIQLSDLDKSDYQALSWSFTVGDDFVGKNVALAGYESSMEDVISVSVNGEPLSEALFKNIPGKPWVIFSDRFVMGDNIEIQYEQSAYPDMVVTNWDANKGDYIFYNTEGSVGIDEWTKRPVEKGILDVWPVPARESCQLTVDSRQSSVVSRQSLKDLKFDIVDLSGQVIKSHKWPEGNNSLEFNTSDILPGTYILSLRNNNRIIDHQKLIIIH
jgi:hypothetical protein